MDTSRQAFGVLPRHDEVVGTNISPDEHCNHRPIQDSSSISHMKEQLAQAPGLYLLPLTSHCTCETKCGALLHRRSELDEVAVEKGRHWGKG